MRAALAIIATMSIGCRDLLGIDEARLFDGPPLPEADAQRCFGAGLVSVCLDKLPTQARTLAVSMLDTATMCDQIVSVPPNEACVIAGTKIDVASATTVRVVGPRPLVLISTSTIEIAGTLSASSARAGVPGAGAIAPCPVGGSDGVDDPGGASGGGGGGFIGMGGPGGTGDLDATPSMGGLPAAALPRALHGGCRGGDGGAGGAGRGQGGAGGGALYLIAVDAIVVTGTITANGAGGQGGLAPDGGGAGGGGGGLVGFEAPSVSATGVVTANGGAGGEGAGNASGVPGEDGLPSAKPARGGGNIAVNGGDGGDGGAEMMDARAGFDGVGGGGGGGGGVGYVYVLARMITFTGVSSPNPTIANGVAR